MKKLKFSIISAVMMALLMCPAAVFACDPITCNAGSLTGYNAGYIAGGVLTFGYDGSRKISFIPGQVTAATGGAHDPIIGAWQTLYNPNQYNFDYVMTARRRPAFGASPPQTRHEPLLERRLLTREMQPTPRIICGRMPRQRRSTSTPDRSPGDP